jgi:transcriptional regulator with XRE-family HTH domain
MDGDKQKQIFAKNLNKYMSLNGKRQIDVARDLGIEKTTLNMWCNGNSIPSVWRMQRLADYFKIKKSDLLDDVEEEKPVCTDCSKENQTDSVLKILYQQIQLLAEESRNAKDNGNGWKSGLTEYSETMCHLSNAYANILDVRDIG